MWELIFWIVGLLLAIWGICILVGSSFFWGLVLLAVGMYFLKEASDMSDGR